MLSQKNFISHVSRIAMVVIFIASMQNLTMRTDHFIDEGKKNTPLIKGKKYFVLLTISSTAQFIFYNCTKSFRTAHFV